MLCTFQGYCVVCTQNVKGKHSLRCKQFEVEAPYHENNNNDYGVYQDSIQKRFTFYMDTFFFIERIKRR